MQESLLPVRMLLLPGRLVLQGERVRVQQLLRVPGISLNEEEASAEYLDKQASGEHRTKDGPEDVATIDDQDDNAAAPTVTAAFKADCMQSNLLENWDVCKNHCSPYICCFCPIRSCYKEKDSECEHYYLCEDLFFNKEEASAKYLDKQASVEHWTKDAGDREAQ